MATDIFLQLATAPSSQFSGESVTKGHEREINVLAFSWGAEQAVTSGARAGGAGKAQFGALSVTKYVDRSSPELFGALCSGMHLPTGKLMLCRAGGAGLREVLRYEFTGLQVSKVELAVSSGTDASPTENVEFVYSTIKTVYTPFDASGKAQTAISKGWDVAANRAS